MKRNPRALAIAALVGACSGSATLATTVPTPTETAAPVPTAAPTAVPTSLPVATVAPTAASACEMAIADAAAISDIDDQVTDLDPAIAACSSLDEFAAIAARYPAALDGADAAEFVTNRCLYEASLVDTAICKGLK